MTNVSLFEQLSKTLKPENQQMETIATVMESAMTRLHCLVKPFFFVDEARINGDCVEVVYQKAGDDVEEWFEGNISLERLRAYVVKEGLNNYCFDWSDCYGEHQQSTITIPIDIFLEDWENLNHAVAEYLRDGNKIHGVEAVQQ